MDQNSTASDTSAADNPWRKPPGGGSARPKPLKAKEAALWVLGMLGVVAAVPMVLIAIQPSKEAVAAQEQAEADEAFYQKVEEDVRRRLRDPGSAAFRDMFVWRKTGAACGEVNGRNGFGGMAGYSHFAYHDGRIAFLEDDSKEYLRLIRPCTRARYLSAVEETRTAMKALEASPMDESEKARSLEASRETIAGLEANIAAMANEPLLQ